MLYHRAALILGFIIKSVASERQINGVASSGNTIHLEENLAFEYSRATINVNSPVVCIISFAIKYLVYDNT